MLVGIKRKGEKKEKLAKRKKGRTTVFDTLNPQIMSRNTQRANRLPASISIP
jgi:hypothetical protein